jgi:hypothetical protein
MKVGKHKFEQLVWIVVLIAAFSAIGFLLYKRLDIPVRDEYTGTILDKWAAYSHLDQGSFVNYRLLVESESGERFKVVVDFETFRRAEIGMRIKRSKSGIELGRLRNLESEGEPTIHVMGVSGSGETIKTQRPQSSSQRPQRSLAVLCVFPLRSLRLNLIVLMSTEFFPSLSMRGISKFKTWSRWLRLQRAFCAL